MLAATGDVPEPLSQTDQARREAKVMTEPLPRETHKMRSSRLIPPTALSRRLRRPAAGRAVGDRWDPGGTHKVAGCSECVVMVDCMQGVVGTDVEREN